MAETGNTKARCKTAAYEKLYDAIFAGIANPQDGQQHSFSEKYQMLENGRMRDCARRGPQGETYEGSGVE